jgi:carboxylesterase type B
VDGQVERLYLDVFTRITRIAYTQLCIQIFSHTHLPSTAHGSDVGFVFNGSTTTSFFDSNITISDPFDADERRLAFQMMQLWTSFAKTGKPTLDG